MMQLRFATSWLILLCLFGTAACQQRPCDRTKAIRVARDKAVAIGIEKNHTAAAAIDKGKSWLVDIYDPNAGVGGHSYLTVEKGRCVVTDIQSFQ